MNIDYKLHKIARELKNALLDYMENPEDTWRLSYISMYKAYYLKLKKKKNRRKANMYNVTVFNKASQKRFTKTFSEYYDACKFYYKCLYSKKVILCAINFDPNR